MNGYKTIGPIMLLDLSSMVMELDRSTISPLSCQAIGICNMILLNYFRYWAESHKFFLGAICSFIRRNWEHSNQLENFVVAHILKVYEDKHSIILCILLFSIFPPFLID